MSRIYGNSKRCYDGFMDINLILKKVAEVKKIDESLILSQSRKAPLPDCRHLFSFIALEIGYTQQYITNFLNRKNHSSVIHSKEQAENLFITDRQFKFDYLRIKKELNVTPISN